MATRQRPSTEQEVAQIGSAATSGFAAGGPVGAGIGAGAAVGAQQVAGAANIAQGEDITATQAGALALPTFGASLVYYGLQGVGGNKKVQKEGKRRRGLINRYSEIFNSGEEGMMLPDGTRLDFSSDGGGAERDFRNPNMRTDKLGEDRKLYDYEVDYTNDMDYFASMGGITFSRLVGGSDNAKATDQAGSLLGNQSLGTVGTGADFTRENFLVVTNNQRAIYAQAGIHSKEDFLALSNEAYADGRLEADEYATAEQVADMVYDDNFELASSLMETRWEGTEKAHSSKRHPDDRPGRIHKPGLSFEEARLSLQPMMEWYDANRPDFSETSSKQKDLDTASGVMGLVSAGIGLYNRFSGGGATKAPGKPNLISASVKSANVDTLQTPEAVGGVGGVDMDIN